ncbi:MAG: PKD domain-containing protein [Phycisphaerae bacterium]|nr:PKD domain-containing protein [Phycisphaerae bacterium]
MKAVRGMSFAAAGAAALSVWAGFASGQCVFSEVTRVGAFDGSSSDRFGSSVAVGSDRFVIGAPDDFENLVGRGTAHVFRRLGGVWCLEAKLFPQEAAAAKFFGRSVGISGSRVVVGAPEDNHAGTQSGAAFVFAFDGVKWSQQAKLTASDAAAQDFFGSSVSIDGNVVIVGAPIKGGFIGAAYLYRWNGASWVSEGKISASDGALGHQFGTSVSVLGGRAVVGSVNARVGGVATGAAYVYEVSGAVWGQTSKLFASDGGAGDHFGAAVSLGANRVLIGAPEDDDRGSDAGAAYVFDYSGSWSQTVKLTSAAGAADDRLGASVAVSGGVAVCGARNDDGAGGSNAGSAAVFRLEMGSWVERTGLMASDGAAEDGLGTSVGLGGGVVVLGAPGDDDAGGNAGSAYVFDEPGVVVDEVPLGQTVMRGQPAHFVVRASAAGTATYLWRRGGMMVADGIAPGGGMISGSSTSCLRLSAAGDADAGSYECVVTDRCVSVTTAAAALAVVGAPCAGDANQDGQVNFADITQVLTSFNLSCP